MLQIKNIKCPIDKNTNYNHEYLIGYIKEVLINKYHFKEVFDINILQKSLDARTDNLYYLLRASFNYKGSYKKNKDISLYIEDEDYLHLKNIHQVKGINKKIIVVGMGPSGLFNALILAKYGFDVTIIEQGKKVEERIKDIDKISKGEFIKSSNVQFGEGGAGTFSDGKLTTGISSPYIKYIKEVFYELGSDISILYDHYPHIGSDILQKVIINFRHLLESLGVKIYFNTKLIDISNHSIITNNPLHKELNFDELVLACGHSAFDVYKLLEDKGISMSPKNFAVGVRIESSAKKVSYNQYHGDYPNLPNASYKLVTHLNSGRSVYSFCMCPGGVVLNSTSDENRLVTNGMSNFSRDGLNSNSALLVNVNVDDYYHGNIFDGMKFIEGIESRAFNKEHPYYYPLETVDDFLNDTDNKVIKEVIPSIKSGYYFRDFNELFPSFITESLKEALPIFGNMIEGLLDDAVMVAPETRSSSTIQITRGTELSTSREDIYAVGEGAGYAGGIISSAVDGIKIALKIIEKDGKSHE